MGSETVQVDLLIAASCCNPCLNAMGSLVKALSLTYTHLRRFLGNSERLLKWSGRRKKKLRESSSNRGTDQPISALQSFAAWGKAIDRGEQKKKTLDTDGVVKADIVESDSDSDSDSESDSTESDDTEDDDAGSEEVDEVPASKKPTLPRYQSDVVVMGSTRPSPSFMSTLKGADGVTARQPSIVRDLWAQVPKLFI